MRRREFITLVGGAAAAWPLAAWAQQSAIPMVGVLGSGSAAGTVRQITAFRSGLSETSYIEGKNVLIQYRWAEGHNDRLPELAAALVQQHVALILTIGGTPKAQSKTREPSNRSRSMMPCSTF